MPKAGRVTRLRRSQRVLRLLTPRGGIGVFHRVCTAVSTFHAAPVCTTAKSDVDNAARANCALATPGKQFKAELFPTLRPDGRRRRLLMARFKKMVIAGTSDPSDVRPPDPAKSDWPGKAVVAVARAAVRELPALPPAESDRLAGYCGRRSPPAAPLWPWKRSRRPRCCVARFHSPPQSRTARRSDMSRDSSCGRPSAALWTPRGHSQRPTSMNTWRRRQLRAAAHWTSGATSCTGQAGDCTHNSSRRRNQRMRR